MPSASFSLFSHCGLSVTHGSQRAKTLATPNVGFSIHRNAIVVGTSGKAHGVVSSARIDAAALERGVHEQSGAEPDQERQHHHEEGVLEGHLDGVPEELVVDQPVEVVQPEVAVLAPRGSA